MDGSPGAGPSGSQLRLNKACSNCSAAKVACDKGRPCGRCIKAGIESSCMLVVRRKKAKVHHMEESPDPYLLAGHDPHTMLSSMTPPLSASTGANPNSSPALLSSLPNTPVLPTIFQTLSPPIMTHHHIPITPPALAHPILPIPVAFPPIAPIHIVAPPQPQIISSAAIGWATWASADWQLFDCDDNFAHFLGYANKLDLVYGQGIVLWGEMMHPYMVEIARKTMQDSLSKGVTHFVRPSAFRKKQPGMTVLLLCSVSLSADNMLCEVLSHMSDGLSDEEVARFLGWQDAPSQSSPSSSSPPG
eukprot:TRINITY_DN10389_c0_g1_i3.p1 TRINITY_DN10389_c0_g1~~TRINITY_DN10389_c0_g1_i3.p1  ORF type:complete len:303 (-),score=51.90 TRINITY_DN10389_c0_g1_i3:119-1027(-)